MPKTTDNYEWLDEQIMDIFEKYDPAFTVPGHKVDKHVDSFMGEIKALIEREKREARISELREVIEMAEILQKIYPVIPLEKVSKRLKDAL